MKSHDIFLKLKHGDLKIIAEATGLSDSCVTQIVNGNRNHNTVSGNLIKRAAKKIIQDRADLHQLCADIRKHAIEDVNPALYGKENYSNSFQEL